MNIYRTRGRKCRKKIVCFLFHLSVHFPFMELVVVHTFFLQSIFWLDSNSLSHSNAISPIKMNRCRLVLYAKKVRIFLFYLLIRSYYSYISLYCTLCVDGGEYKKNCEWNESEKWNKKKFMTFTLCILFFPTLPPAILPTKSLFFCFSFYVPRTWHNFYSFYVISLLFSLLSH